ncbi:amine oxidase [Plakobranchus ocellatus]|uniref:Amine oxidase n=1 Tax=Plakobranchus ocellatus TaxID=259542 RepID=A0AAV4DSV9_9GAST|nr:amine oxidase [Plakobranchus ocellatus]
MDSSYMRDAQISHITTTPLEQLTSTMSRVSEMITNQNTPSSSFFETDSLVPLHSSTPHTMVDSTTSPMDKHYSNFLQETLNKRPNEPFTPIEEKLHTRFVKRKLYQNPQETITCKTGGQPIVLKKIVVPRKENKSVKTPTKKKQAKLVQKMREQIAGMSIESAIAMKETVGLTWSQFRTQRKFLKEFGINLPNEARKRRRGQQLIAKYINVESKEFNVEGEIKSKPYATIRNTQNYLLNLLDTYQQNNKLTWHSGTIPEDEIWAKIGADHGKGSFKVCMAVGNLGKPNAKTNTHLIGIAYIKDTHENLKIFKTDVNTKITQLQNTEWNVKRIVVFLHGDYDFLCKVFGLSGPQGTYPCLWCLTTKKELQESTEKEPRTLAFLKSAFEKFKIESGEDKRKAAQYHNCIHKPLIDIELHKVSPPYLHILLGVILKHHRMLEQAADRIDKQIYEDKNPDRADNSCLLSNLGNNWKKWMQKQKEIAFLKGCVAFGEAESSSQTWM